MALKQQMAVNSEAAHRVAIIRNLRLDDGDWGQEMIYSFCELVHANVTNAEIEHFNAIDGGNLPNPAEFDLVILSGGTYDLTKTDLDPWVVRVLDWVKNAVTESPRTKLLGICWGHQVISKALGGQISYNEGGRVISVTDIPLTLEGEKFFGDCKVLRLHKFYVRYVSQKVPGFKYLAEKQDISISESNQVLTFQAHPEMTGKIASDIVKARDPSYLPDPTPEGIAKLHRDLQVDHEGRNVFARAMKWAFEGHE